MEWAEDSRETGATAIAIAICFSPPPSSFQQLKLSFCNQQPDCFQAKQNPAPLQIYIFYPKNSFLLRNRGSRGNNTPLLPPSLVLLLHPNLYLFPHSESWVSATISATYYTEIHNPEKEIQSINRCLFPGFCKLWWFVYEDRLATFEKNLPLTQCHFCKCAF